MDGSVVLRRLVKTLKAGWTAAPIAIGVLIVALAAVVFFGVRTAVHWQEKSLSTERQQPIEGWMTPRYVVRSWNVPPRVVQSAIDVPRPFPGGPVSLKKLAAIRGIPVEDLIVSLEAAIEAHYAETGRRVGGQNAEAGQ